MADDATPTPKTPDWRIDAGRRGGKAAAAALTPQQRILRSRIGGHVRAAAAANRSDLTAEANKNNPGAMAYWERKVDPTGEMDPDERAKSAESARSAYFSQLAFRSAMSRRKARKAAAEAQQRGDGGETE